MKRHGHNVKLCRFRQIVKHGYERVKIGVRKISYIVLIVEARVDSSTYVPDNR